MLTKNLSRMIAAGLLAAALMLATAPVQAQQRYYYQSRDSAYFQRFYDQEPSSAWMMLDMVAARPVGIATTVTGVGLLVGTLPISLATNTTREAARAFVEQPGRWTFQRRLGRPGFDQYYWLP